jgi:hypothetical protein
VGDGVLVACACATGSTDATVEVEVAVRDLTLIAGSPVVRAQGRAIVDVPSR